ncbi:MAG: hypothetical protein ACOC2U_01895 [bacterium]
MKEVSKEILEKQLGNIVFYVGPGPKENSEWEKFHNMELKDQWDFMPSYNHCIHFVLSYFPRIEEKYFNQYLRYKYPVNNDLLKSKLDNIFQADAGERETAIRRVLGIDAEKSCFIFLDDISNLKIEYWSEGESLFDVLKRIQARYVTGKKEPIIRFRLAPEPGSEKTEKEKQEEQFSEFLLKLSHDVRKKLNQFEKEDALNAFIEILRRETLGEQDVSFSPLKIDEKFNLHLPSYGTSIKLTPLEKTAYFLFLNHPEGIMFCDLPDYRNEVAEIYKNVNNRLSLRNSQKSIEKLVNPISNSMSEKLSKVRNSFLFHHDESIVEPYIVIGERGGPKKVKIDRELVIIENNGKFWRFLNCY